MSTHCRYSTVVLKNNLMFMVCLDYRKVKWNLSVISVLENGIQLATIVMFVSKLNNGSGTLINLGGHYKTLSYKKSPRRQVDTGDLSPVNKVA